MTAIQLGDLGAADDPFVAALHRRLWQIYAAMHPEAAGDAPGQECLRHRVGTEDVALWGEVRRAPGQ